MRSIAHVGRLALLSIGLAGSAASASTVATTLGPSGQYDPVPAYFIHNFTGVDDLREANQFTASQVAYLDQIRLAVTAPFSSTERLEVSLVADAGGKPDLTALETWTISGLPSAPDSLPNTSFALTTLTSVLHPVLTAGSKYWITLRTPDANSQDIHWYLSNSAPLGRFAAQGSGYAPGWNAFDFQRQAAFEVTGAPTPGPATAGLLGVVGVAGWRGLGRRRPHGVVGG